MAAIPIPQNIAARAERFTGRDWVLAEVVRWLNQGTERYLLITGEPGSGKTALAAWLAGAGPLPDHPAARIALTHIRSTLSAAHFCVAEDQRGTIHPERFAKVLAHQLSDRYDSYGAALLHHIAPHVNIHVEARENWGELIGARIENLIINTTNVDTVYNTTVREPLEHFCRNHPAMHVLILVDALDEALAFHTPNIITLLAGSGDLPANVRFLLTSRIEPKVIEQFKQVRRLDLSSSAQTAHITSDLRAYVEQRLNDPPLRTQIPAIGTETIINTIVDQAGGNFLYATFLLDEVASGQRALTDMHGLPEGLYGLYRAYLDRLMPDMIEAAASRRWQEQFQPLLGCMSVAIPAAPRAILPDWLQRDESDVKLRLNETRQITEDVGMPPVHLAHRLYHRSMATFLATDTYPEYGEIAINRYYTPPREQHTRIIRYYLETFQGTWEDCDSYGLRQLVGHMQARIALEPRPRERRKHIQELYSVALDPSFQAAQQHILGDAFVTLDDLRTTLDIAIQRNDLVKIIACAGAYRSILRTQSIARMLFDTLKQRDFAGTLQRATSYLAGSDWAGVIYLYLAWEAAEAGAGESARAALSAAGPLPAFGIDPLYDAFQARIARQLAGTHDPRALLAELNPASDPGQLLARYDLAQPLDSIELYNLTQTLDQRLTELAYLVTEGAVEAISLLPFVSGNLQEILTRLAAHPAGQHGIDRALELVATSPYPQYGEIALRALAITCLSVPDSTWARLRLQRILQVKLDQEGVTFTFDLPSVLLAEARRRQQPAPDLARYLDQALACQDRWGTLIRAHSARAAGMHWQGDPAAWDILQHASCFPAGFAGYATITMLALSNRCAEFGQPERADLPTWGQNQDAVLLDLSKHMANQVADYDFRLKRIDLVELYRSWQLPQNLETTRALLANLQDQDTRIACIDRITALLAGHGTLNQAQLHLLVPPALLDATTLDAALARMIGPQIQQLNDPELVEAIQICNTHLITGRPWELGQWS